MYKSTQIYRERGVVKEAKSVWEPLRRIHALSNNALRGGLCTLTVRNAAAKPAGGWPLFIAMHGGGGTAKEVNYS